MKYLNGNYYLEVKGERYTIHPTENIIFKLREEPKSLTTQNQVQNETQKRENQKVVGNIVRLEVKRNGCKIPQKICES